jgi:hypothetical protein
MTITALSGTRALVAPSAPGLTDSGSAGSQSSSLLDEAVEAQADVRVDVHDASRLEWTVAVPLPDKGTLAYTVEVELEIPANVFAPHTAWDQLQSWTRLDGPAGVVGPNDDVTIDALRRGAIAFAHKLARAHDGFARHCRLAGAVSATAALDDLIDKLDLWLAVTAAAAQEARDCLVGELARDSIELQRERRLVDEYVSVRFLEALAGTERSLASLKGSRHVERHERAIAAAEAHVAEMLGSEIALRQDRGYLCADPSSPVALEGYLDRASQLKKHFQEVLFLEADTYQVAQRIHHWVAAFVAILASTWAFAWQIALLNSRPSTGSQVGSGIILLATIAGVGYAAKDRIKEIGRTWISGNVHRFYAQRVARWRAPARRLPDRDVVVSARESFDQTVTSRPDPLNPASRATVGSTVVRYKHRGLVMSHPILLASGVRRVKHIFRYDLSPLFARLDDAVKQVPVLDATTRRVCFVDAPRRYRVPVRLRVVCAGETHDIRATLVLHKGGLDRLESDSEQDSPLDTGVVP